MKLNISPSGTPWLRKRTAMPECIPSFMIREPRIPRMFAGERRKIRRARIGTVWSPVADGVKQGEGYSWGGVLGFMRASAGSRLMLVDIVELLLIIIAQRPAGWPLAFSARGWRE